MSRTYAALYLRIQDDPDFRALPHTEKFVYWTLLIQKKLNRAGLLDYYPARWASFSGDLSTAEIEVVIKSLAQKHYVVLDESTNELLVRTYVRNDGAWKQPKVMASVVSAAEEIDSPILKRALLKELDRIPVVELSDEPTATGGASIRARIVRYVEQMRTILDDGSPDDPERIEHPAGRPPMGGGWATAGASQGYGYPTDTLPDTPSDTRRDTRPIAPGTRARTRGAPSPEPEPEPEKLCAPPVSAPAQLSLVPDLSADEPPRAEESETRNQRANRLARVYTDRVKLSKFLAVAGIVKKAIDGNCTDEQIIAGLNKVADEKRSLTAGTLRHAIEGEGEKRQRKRTPHKNYDDQSRYDLDPTRPPAVSYA